MFFLCLSTFCLLRSHFLNLSSIVERLSVKDALSVFSQSVTYDTLLLVLLLISHMSRVFYLWGRSIECSIILVEFIIFISFCTIESVSVRLEIRVLLHASVEARASIPYKLLFVKLVSNDLCLRISLFVQVRDIIEGSVIVSKTSCT